MVKHLKNLQSQGEKLADFIRDPVGDFPKISDISEDNDSCNQLLKNPFNVSTNYQPQEEQIISQQKKRKKRSSQVEKLCPNIGQPEVLNQGPQRNPEAKKKIIKKLKIKKRYLAESAKGIFCHSKKHKLKIEQNILNKIIKQAIFNSDCDDVEVNNYKELALKKVTKKNNLHQFFQNNIESPEQIKNRAFDSSARAIDKQINNRRQILRKLIYETKVAREENRVAYLQQIYVYKLRLRHEILVRKTSSQ